MKKTFKIILLVSVIFFLSGTLYIFIKTAPKDIKKEEFGTMYNIGEIFFNLSSSNYIENEALQEALIERGGNSENTKGWVDQDGKNSFVVFYTQEDEIFEEKASLLRNPINHLRLEKDLTKEDGYKENGIVKVNLDYYIGNQKTAILERNYKEDGGIVYSFQLKIGNGYYLVVAQQSDIDNVALENIIEFMRTANLKK